MHVSQVHTIHEYCSDRCVPTFALVNGEAQKRLYCERRNFAWILISKYCGNTKNELHAKDYEKIRNFASNIIFILLPTTALPHIFFFFQGAVSFESVQKDVCGKRESILSHDVSLIIWGQAETEQCVKRGFFGRREKWDRPTLHGLLSRLDGQQAWFRNQALQNLWWWCTAVCPHL